ncbi:MAG TPA: methyltransferase domain-containing protein [Acidimicrobiales bacterium]|jgi:SAM-dependent methyltransferase|nr:methyltransferase domain-containing protein [Acidimicrobiales bacterium]
MSQSRRALRAAYHRSRSVARAARGGGIDFETMAPADAVDTAYQVMLRRHPDPSGLQTSMGQLQSGAWSNRDMVDALRASSEFHRYVRFPPRMFGHSLHSSRCEFMRSLPPGRRILDLGGTALGNPEGGMVSMGYPYDFESLTIVDLPSEDRHAIYQEDSRSDQVETARGPVRYRYHSMADLSDYQDGSIDLVYSGQSIEHVTPEEGLHVLQEVHRVLAPGGHLGIDTPNARVTRLQQDEFVDPDHKVEYRLEELVGIIEKAGLEVVDCKGANYSGAGLAAGAWDPEEVAGNTGLYWDAASCYLLCLVARKPL